MKLRYSYTNLDLILAYSLFLGKYNYRGAMNRAPGRATGVRRHKRPSVCGLELLVDTVKTLKRLVHEALSY